jgi:inner membrane protein involved in colicin E2 resistance
MPHFAIDTTTLVGLMHILVPVVAVRHTISNRARVDKPKSVSMLAIAKICTMETMQTK